MFLNIYNFRVKSGGVSEFISEVQAEPVCHMIKAAADTCSRFDHMVSVKCLFRRKTST
jgi:hypothetical protein